MDGVDVELHLVPTPSIPGLPLDALLGRVSEERIGHLMVAELRHHVG
jgi:hypothetical protein